MNKAILATFLLAACMISAVSAGAAPAAEVDTMCANAEFKETCKKTLSEAQSSEPKGLLLSSFNSTVENLRTAITKSKTYQDASTDKRTKGALVVCEQVLNTTVNNIKRSMARIDKFEVSDVDDYVDDVKVWLSAGVSCKDTCVDAFENTTGKLIMIILLSLFSSNCFIFFYFSICH